MKTPILVLEYAPLIDLQSYICPGGEIGRHKRLKISRSQGRAGSIPAPGTNNSKAFMHSTH